MRNFLRASTEGRLLSPSRPWFGDLGIWCQIAIEATIALKHGGGTAHQVNVQGRLVVQDGLSRLSGNRSGWRSLSQKRGSPSGVGSEAQSPMYHAGVRGRAYNTDWWRSGVGRSDSANISGRRARSPHQGAMVGSRELRHAPQCGLGDPGSRQGGEGWKNERKEVW